MRTPPHILIIGGGLAGAAVLLRLLKDARAPLRITVAEPREAIGPGLAYSTPNLQHLLNGLAESFSIDAQEPQHFVQWLATHAAQFDWQPDDGTPLEKSIPPRRLYGAYIRDTLAQVRSEAAAEVALTHRRARVVALHRQPDAGYRAEFEHGDALHADHVVLATGVFQRQASALPFQVEAGVLDSPRYVANVWASHAWDGVAHDRSLALLGAGLSSLDALISAEQAGFQGDYVTFSRRGQPLHARVEGPPWPEFLQYPASGVRVLPLLQQINAERRRLRAQGDHWQRLVPAIRPHVPALWAAASLAERRRFLHRLRAYWEASLHRCAAPALAWQERATQGGRYRQQRSTIVALRLQADGRIAVTHRTSHTGEQRTDVFDRVVNCLGFEFDWRRTGDPLQRQLIESGLVQPDPLGFGIQADPAPCAVLDAHGQPQPGLYAIGHPLRGTIWESNAIPEQVPQATRIASAILADAQAPRAGALAAPTDQLTARN